LDVLHVDGEEAGQVEALRQVGHRADRLGESVQVLLEHAGVSCLGANLLQAGRELLARLCQGFAVTVCRFVVNLIGISSVSRGVALETGAVCSLWGRSWGICRTIGLFVRFLVHSAAFQGKKPALQGTFRRFVFVRLKFVQFGPLVSFGSSLSQMGAISMGSSQANGKRKHGPRPKILTGFVANCVRASLVVEHLGRATGDRSEQADDSNQCSLLLGHFVGFLLLDCEFDFTRRY